MAIRAWAERHGRPPKRRDWLASGPGHPEGGVIYRVFGDWRTALEAAGLPTPPPPPRRDGGWDAAAVLDAVDEWEREHGEPPTVVDWNPSLARLHGCDERAQRWEGERPRWPHASAAARQFGGWNRMLAAAERRRTVAGLKRNAPRPLLAADGRLVAAWTRDEVVEAIRAWHREHGRWPTADQWRNRDPSGRRPSSSTVQRVCGGWHEALAAAGKPIPAKLRDDIARMLASGLSQREVGQRLGISRGAVARVVAQDRRRAGQ